MRPPQKNQPILKPFLAIFTLFRRRGHKPSSTWSTIQREWRGVCWFPTLVGIYRGACAIQLEDSVVVTGGYAPKNTPKSEAPHKAFRRVQRYNLAGSLGRLLDLGSGRYDHACGHFVNTDNKMVGNLPTLTSSINSMY